jgi:hypothetical protein
MNESVNNRRATTRALSAWMIRVVLMLILTAVTPPAFSATASPSPTDNLALGKAVVASSVAGKRRHRSRTTTAAENAVDGDTSTRWSSLYADPQWIYVDLGAAYTVDRVVLNWEFAYARSYQIQVSADAQNWATVFSQSNGDGGIDDISLAPVSARYVRMLGLQRGTQYGYSLWEIGVYGSSTTSTGSTPGSTGTSGSTTGSTSTSGSTSSGTTTGSDTSTTSTNHPPAISGTPATSVTAGHTYSFQPSASDADGDTLAFTISNKPSWASFSSATGQLSGTPGTGNVGTYSNIVIAVSDGKTSTSLPAFSIRVDAGAALTGSLSLQWKAPLTRADGTPLPLSEINGYRIHYGNAPGNYTSHVDLADGTAQQVTLTDLPVGTYYLVMSTYDVNGLESGYSASVSKNVQ